jgi:ketosteroid isomerase-like protein
MADYKEVYLASTRAYQDRDIDAMMDYVTDDFSWYNIMPDGPMQLADGKDKAKQGMKMVFDNIDYVEGHVDFAKQFGDLLVAVETDTIRQEGEEVKMRRLSLYECTDGKLHRCWSFPIKEDQE